MADIHVISYAGHLRNKGAAKIQEEREIIELEKKTVRRSFTNGFFIQQDPRNKNSQAPQNIHQGCSRL